MYSEEVCSWIQWNVFKGFPGLRKPLNQGQRILVLAGPTRHIFTSYIGKPLYYKQGSKVSISRCTCDVHHSLINALANHLLTRCNYFVWLDRAILITIIVMLHICNPLLWNCGLIKPPSLQYHISNVPTKSRSPTQACLSGKSLCPQPAKGNANKDLWANILDKNAIYYLCL